MPSTATITSFYTFTQNTKARASEVNTNFSVFRGHILPINTDTASASDLTYNLGATDHRWGTLYVNSIELATSTSTINFPGGAFIPSLTATAKFSFSVTGIDWHTLTTLSTTNSRGNTMKAHLRFHQEATFGSSIRIFSYASGGGSGVRHRIYRDDDTSTAVYGGRFGNSSSLTTYDSVVLYDRNAVATSTVKYTIEIYLSSLTQTSSIQDAEFTLLELPWE